MITNWLAAKDAVTPPGMDCCTILRTMPEPVEVAAKAVPPEVTVAVKLSVATLAAKNTV